jgi:hypothetical protein
MCFHSVTGIALLSCVQIMFVPHRNHIYLPPRPVTDSFTLLYADHIRASQETHVSASTACYG